MPSKAEMLWKEVLEDISGYIVKAELVINTDSSFKFSTCSTTSSGTWTVLKDSLLLHVHECRRNNDSLNKVG
jgi:hypothetical protein